MAHNHLGVTSRIASSVVVSAVAIALCSCGGDDSPSEPAPAKATNPNNVPSAPPPMTVDIEKVTKDLGSAYQAKADAFSKLAKGTSLDAAQTKQLYDAQVAIAKTCEELSNMLKKTPRWQRTITAALEKNTKKSIIAGSKAEGAYRKAKSANKAGSTAQPMPPEMAKQLDGSAMTRMRIEGLMSYSKGEME